MTVFRLFMCEVYVNIGDFGFSFQRTSDVYYEHQVPQAEGVLEQGDAGVPVSLQLMGPQRQNSVVRRTGEFSTFLTR